jgi:hypothetical protein
MQVRTCILYYVTCVSERTERENEIPHDTCVRGATGATYMKKN